MRNLKVRYITTKRENMNDAIIKYCSLFGIQSDNIEYIKEFTFSVTDVREHVHNGVFDIKHAKFWVAMVYCKKDNSDGFVFKEFDDIESYSKFCNVILSDVSYWLDVIENKKRIAKSDYERKLNEFWDYINKVKSDFSIGFEVS